MVTILIKHFILDSGEGSEYLSGLFNLVPGYWLKSGENHFYCLHSDQFSYIKIFHKSRTEENADSNFWMHNCAHKLKDLIAMTSW